jgi:hypothetical protein
MIKICSRLLAALAAFFFFSCGTPYWELEGMFSEIEKEIKLEDGVVKGNVYSLIEYDGKLLAGGGLIYYKEPSDRRGWHKFWGGQPGGDNDRVIRLAAGYDGKEYLYALTASTDTDGVTTYKVWHYSSGSGWARIASSTKTIAIFGNNAVSTGGANDGSDNRAYLNDGTDVFELRGPAVATAVTASDGNGKTKSSKAAAFLIGGSAPDKTYFSDRATFCSDGERLYEGNGTPVKYGTSTNALNESRDVSGTIYSLWATSDYVYAGTDTGAKQIPVNGGSLGSAEGLPGSNAEAAIGSYRILSIFAFAEGTKYTPGTAVYAAALGKTTYQGSKNNGLWGYYSDRGNWNKE